MQVPPGSIWLDRFAHFVRRFIDMSDTGDDVLGGVAAWSVNIHQPTHILYVCTHKSLKDMDNLFKKAAERRSKALAEGPLRRAAPLSAGSTPVKTMTDASGGVAVQTPLKNQGKRATKSTPTQAATPTPTPGQKHLKMSSPADDKLKMELAYPEESVSTEAPPGPCFSSSNSQVDIMQYMCMYIGFSYVYMCEYAIHCIYKTSTTPYTAIPDNKQSCRGTLS